MSFLSKGSSWARCQPIASPSRSGSVATYKMSARSAAFLSSSRIFFLLGATTYFGLKPFLGSTPSADLGRSRTWPIEAFTMNLESRYFWIVLTFVGDSTTTKARLPLLATRRSPRGRPTPPSAGPRAVAPTHRARARRAPRQSGRAEAPHASSAPRYAAVRQASTRPTPVPPRYPVRVVHRFRCPEGHEGRDAMYPIILARHHPTS